MENRKYRVYQKNLGYFCARAFEEEYHAGEGHHDDWLRADMELTFGMVNDEGLFDTVSKNEISEEKLNHICEIAVLHLEYRKGEEEKEL